MIAKRALRLAKEAADAAPVLQGVSVPRQAEK
jgi:hypothetical protein